MAMLGRVCKLSLVSGLLRLLIASSQFHPYEGYPLTTVVYPIRLMARLGVKSLISTPSDCPSASASLS
jgi:purine nucleoside phosphorylase